MEDRGSISGYRFSILDPRSSISAPHMNDEIRFLLGQQFRVDGGEGQVSGQGTCHRGTIAGEQYDFVDSQGTQFGKDLLCFWTNPVAGADGAHKFAGPSYQQGSLPFGVEIIEQ